MTVFMMTEIEGKDAGKAFANCFPPQRAEFLVALAGTIEDWEDAGEWEDACQATAALIPEDKREAVKDKLVTLVNMIWEKELGNAD